MSRARDDPSLGSQHAPVPHPLRLPRPEIDDSRALASRPAGRAAALGMLAVLGLAMYSAGRAQTAGAADARVEAHLGAAQVAQAAKDYAAAAKEYEAVVSIRPDWALARQSLGVAYHLAGRYEPAIEQLSRAVALDSELWGAFLFLGMDYYRVGRFEEAVAALDRCIALNPGQEDARRWLGLSLAALQRYEEAIRHLSGLAAGGQADEDTLFHLARAYDNRATQLFEGIGRIEPDSPFVYLLQAERFAAEGETERARSEYRRALEERPDLAGTINAASDGPGTGGSGESVREEDRFAPLRGAFGAARYGEAARIAREALAANPDDTEGMYWLGRSYKGFAALTVDRLSAVAPESHRVDQLRAEQHAGRTEFAKALKAYGRALAKRPALPGLRYAIGDVHRRAGRLREAIRWFSEEIERNPHHALARYRLGGLLLDQGRAGDAVEHLEAAIAAGAGFLEARFELGRAYLEKGDYASAIRELEGFARSEPSHERARFLLANAYSRTGRAEDAAREIERYRELSRRRLERVQRDVRSVSEDLRQGR